MNSPASIPIHAASMFVQNEGIHYVFLRKLESYRYIWFRETAFGVETETPIWGGSAEEAILSAYRTWKNEGIRFLHCGFRYTLPERDEVGTNALFHQMAASYSSSNGIYFDEEVSSNCIVQFASTEARDLWKRLQNTLI